MFQPLSIQYNSKFRSEIKYFSTFKFVACKTEIKHSEVGHECIFGSTDCKTLFCCDFSDSKDLNRWIQDKGWKSTCDVYLKYVMNKCIKMAEEGKLL